MVEFICKSCRHKDWIKWGVTGDKLKSLEINFECKKCSFPHKLTVLFRKDKKLKQTIERDDKNYIG